MNIIMSLFFLAGVLLLGACDRETSREVVCGDQTCEGEERPSNCPVDCPVCVDDRCDVAGDEAALPPAPELVSAIYAGGPIYYSADYSIDELRQSGFTTVVVWTIHINERGDLNFNAEFPLVEDGTYVGDASYPDFADDVMLLKSPPTSIDRVEFGLSAWGSSTFDNIRDLVNSEGTSRGSILYRNFAALKRRIPAVDALNFDDESTYDAGTATDFAIMAADLGYRVTLCPYAASNFWSTVAANVNEARPGAVDAVYLQVYAGGAGNNPCTWAARFDGIPLYPGLWDRHDSPAQLERHLNIWQADCGISGGFLWLYDDIDNTDLVARYAAAVNDALAD